MRYPKDQEIIAALRLETNYILVRREGSRTMSEAGLTLPGGGIKTPFARILTLGPEYKGSLKKGDRVLYTESHVIPEIDVGSDKNGNLAIVNPAKIIASVASDLFEDKNGDAATTQASV